MTLRTEEVQWQVDKLVNLWVIIGTVVCQPNEFKMPDSAVLEDMFMLTTPLETQVAVSAHQWLNNIERWDNEHDGVQRRSTYSLSGYD